MHIVDMAPDDDNADDVLQAWECANKLGLIGPAMEQPQYNLFEREKVEKDYLPLYKRFGTGLTTWSPLASGVLSGKYSKDNIPEGSRLALEAYKVWPHNAFAIFMLLAMCVAAVESDLDFDLSVWQLFRQHS